MFAPLMGTAGASNPLLSGSTPGGFTGSSSATSGPASNRSINILGVGDGSYGSLNNLLTIASGASQNGGYTPTRGRVVAADVSGPVGVPTMVWVGLAVIVGVALLMR